MFNMGELLNISLQVKINCTNQNVKKKIIITDWKHSQKCTNEKTNKTKTKYQTTCINKLHIKIWTCYKSFVKDYHKAYTYFSKYPLKTNKRNTVYRMYNYC